MRVFVAALFLSLFISLSISGQTSPVDTSPHKSDFVTVNGVRLHYLDWGGSGEAVLFLHGFPGSSHNFDELAPTLVDKFRVLGLTRRGHGQSEKVETGYDIANRVEDIRQFLDHLKIGRVNLVGFSAGGDELTQFTASHPDRVIRLVYLEAAYDRTDLPRLLPLDPFEDPANPEKLSKIDKAMIQSMDTFVPNYRKIKAPILSYYAIFEQHWAVKPDTDAAQKKRADEFMENIVRPRQFKNIAQMQKQAKHAKVVVLRNTDQNFYRDPKLKDEVAKEIRRFLLSTVR
jgi:pimeloyl-ACP methyl ester carboxylesterase